MGLEIAKDVLAGGHSAVATKRPDLLLSQIPSLSSGIEQGDDWLIIRRH